MRRFVSVWLPHWPIERLCRVSPSAVPAEAPLALIASVQGRLTLSAVNAPARREGLAAGWTLADARAAVPSLATRPAEPSADLRALRRLALWLSRYGPRVAIERAASGHSSKGKARALAAAVDAPDGISIEINGVAHLFGGETALLADLVRRLAGLGLTVRPGLADTPGAAWAVARAVASRRLAGRIIAPGDTAAGLAGLPVAALRLLPETVTLLKRLGLKSIGDLMHLPRPGLERRFKSKEAAAAVLTRLDQALGALDEPARALMPPPRFAVRQNFAEPLVSSEGVMATLGALAHRLGEDLAANHQGARRLVLALYRADGSLARIAAGLSRPSRDAAHFHRLLADRLAGVDLGFGVDLMTLAAPASEPLGAGQAGLSGLAPRTSDGEALLVDRLVSRLGAGKVLMLSARASHLPEEAEVRVPALAGNATPPLDPPPRQSARPPFLLPHPEPVAVVAEIPDGPPASLEWRRRRCRIVKAQGPERIAPEWWQPLLAMTREAGEASSAKHRPRTRDYYTIEDEAGRRYWVFREGLYGREESDDPPAWYLHGLFA
jgi:protein ImuB